MADALVHLDEFAGEFLKPPVLGDLLPGGVERAGGNGSLPDLLLAVMLEEPGGAVAWMVRAGATAVRLPALAKTGEQETRTEISDPAQLLAERVAALEKVGEGVGGHGVAS